MRCGIIEFDKSVLTKAAMDSFVDKNDFKIWKKRGIDNITRGIIMKILSERLIICDLCEADYPEFNPYRVCPFLKISGD